jgi:hypothetical protein
MAELIEIVQYLKSRGVLEFAEAHRVGEGGWVQSHLYK